jgi:tetratricopeptide (TPR) repeat protein
MKTAVVLLALRLIAAGAQAPEDLWNEFVATDSAEVLSRVNASLAALPESHAKKVWKARVLLAEGDAARALDAAVRLNQTVPDDLDTYALIVDASLLLGIVEQAEKSAQWMLNLRPEDVRSLMRGAAVREALGDHEGVVQMLTAALARTSRTETALRAAMGVSLARASYRLGRLDAADRLLRHIESLIRGYMPARKLRREMENKS